MLPPPSACHPPLPPHPSDPLPYPHAHPHAPDHPTPLPSTPQPIAQAEGAGPAPKEDHHKVQSHFNGPISRRSPSSPRCGCRACPKGGPPQGAVPLQRPNPPPGPNPQAKAAGRLVSLCRFPAIFRPGPRPHVRPAPCQIRLVSLFRPFQHPPAGPSAPHPGHAWQIRLVSLCRLVRRASIPSCAAPPQARAGRKTALTLFRSNQIAPCPAGASCPCPGRLTPHRQGCYPPTHISTKRSEGE